jgi:hypothetical protein
MARCEQLFHSKDIATRAKANKRFLHSSTASREPLQLVYPFDPVMLRESERRLSLWYKTWRGERHRDFKGADTRPADLHIGVYDEAEADKEDSDPAAGDQSHATSLR